jgi:GNAT superfamily N-acetyltransferase
MRIRQAEPADAEAIAVIHVRAWQTAYRGLIPQGYLDALDSGERQCVWRRRLAETHWPKSGTLVAETDGHVIGFARLCATRDEDEDPATVGEIAAIYLTTEIWGTGVGRRLMSAALETLARAGYREATLWVLETNARARRFYEAGGWRGDGAVRQDEVDGVLLTDLRYRHPVG